MHLPVWCKSQRRHFVLHRRHFRSHAARLLLPEPTTRRARGAGTPHRFSPSAIWRSDAPPALIGRMRGSRSAARLAALAAIAALPLAGPPSWLERLAGVPSLTPRALAASRAALVR